MDLTESRRSELDEFERGVEESESQGLSPLNNLLEEELEGRKEGGKGKKRE